VIDRAARWRRRTATVIASALITTYFAAVIVHVGPLNTVKIRHGDQASRVLVPYFDQNWSLFAPDPISSERGILVRGRESGTARVTEWLDVTSSANSDSRSRVLLSPRTSRIISNGLSMYLSPNPYRALIIEKATAEDLEIDESAFELTPEEESFQSNAVEMMVRYASTRALVRWGSSIDEIQIRIVVHDFPAFSQRSQWGDVGSIRTEDLPWADVARGVGE